jgi:hypothetical protein
MARFDSISLRRAPFLTSSVIVWTRKRLASAASVISPERSRESQAIWTAFSTMIGIGSSIREPTDLRLSCSLGGSPGGKLGTNGYIDGLCASGDAFKSEADIARTEAEKCRRLAVRAADRIDKDALQRMADEWLRLAQANVRNVSKTISIQDAAN